MTNKRWLKEKGIEVDSFSQRSIKGGYEKIYRFKNGQFAEVKWTEETRYLLEFKGVNDNGTWQVCGGSTDREEAYETAIRGKNIKEQKNGLSTSK